MSVAQSTHTPTPVTYKHNSLRFNPFFVFWHSLFICRVSVFTFVHIPFTFSLRIWCVYLSFANISATHTRHTHSPLVRPLAQNMDELCNVYILRWNMNSHCGRACVSFAGKNVRTSNNSFAWSWRIRALESTGCRRSYCWVIEHRAGPKPRIRRFSAKIERNIEIYYLLLFAWIRPSNVVEFFAFDSTTRCLYSASAAVCSLFFCLCVWFCELRTINEFERSHRRHSHTKRTT